MSEVSDEAKAYAEDLAHLVHSLEADLIRAYIALQTLVEETPDTVAECKKIARKGLKDIKPSIEARGEGDEAEV